jgi:acyl-[acyl carrier protein]--UDP-N-acetylglucosamine O-acyltransferase
MSEIAGTAVVSPDTVVGADVTVEDAAVVGKHPSLGNP